MTSRRVSWLPCFCFIRVSRISNIHNPETRSADFRGSLKIDDIDRENLQNPDEIERLQDAILNLLGRYVADAYPEQPVRLSKLLLKLNQIRVLVAGNQHQPVDAGTAFFLIELFAHVTLGGKVS